MNRYIEPFLGGGAVFFGLCPQHALLSDVNDDLINTYIQVRNSWPLLVNDLKRIPVDSETYQRMRESNPACGLERAVRFLYLNRTAFAGMYRVDHRGRFNVPFGGGQRTPAPLWEKNLLKSASSVLQGVSLLTSDFQPVIDSAGDGDLVYCDPTYTVAHNNNGFVRYNEKNFSWRDQETLARACHAAASRGAMVMVSNAFHRDIKLLYPNAETRVLERWSGISPVASKRRRAQEYLFVLDDRI